MLARLTGRIKSCPFLLAVAAVVGLSRAFSPIPVYAPSCNQRGVMRSRNSFLGSPFLQQGKNCHFQRCSSKLSMMFDQLTEKMAGVAQLLQGKKTISTASVEGALKDVKRALLDADVNLGVTNRLVEAVKEKAVGMEVTEGVTPEQQFIKVMYDQLVEVMGSAASPLARRSDDNPTVILLAGLQGTGKTTAAAKLAKYLEEGKEPRSVLLVAGDIYRPAAIDQLQTLGQQIEVEVFSMGQDVDPVDITNAGIAYAKEKGYDTVIVDTAGRQVVDEDLMTELKNIQVASNPDEVLLVVDAMTGQEAATLTSVFNQKIGITGAVLTKLDGDTRGGSALSVQMDELEPFYPDRMASRILGMGDVVSLVEKAEKQMSEKEAERMAKKMMDETFDFEDFIRQSKMIKSMGNMAGVAKMIPGMAGKISQAKLDGAEERLKRAEALIASMTEAERKDPDLLTLDPTAPSRLRRISKGAGLRIKDASDFISEFQQMRTIMSRMGKQMQGQNGGNMFDPASMMGGGNQMANENGVALGNRQQRRTSKKTKGKNGNGGLVKGFSKR